MSKIDWIRAWKDPAYRESLGESERAAMPAHPAGLRELDECELERASGGAAFAVAGGDLSSGQGKAKGDVWGIFTPPVAQIQTVTQTIDVCCSTGDLPCNGNTQDLLCIVVKG